MESNYILKFFIGTLIFLVLGVLQMIARKLLIIWFPLPIQDFQDLCCLANVSMIFFDHNLHGYYLHGKTPAGVAEGDLQWLAQVLEKEGK